MNISIGIFDNSGNNYTEIELGLLTNQTEASNLILTYKNYEKIMRSLISQII